MPGPNEIAEMLGATSSQITQEVSNHGIYVEWRATHLLDQRFDRTVWALTPKFLQGEQGIRFAEPLLGIELLQLVADGGGQHPAPHLPEATEARIDIIEIVDFWVGKAAGSTQRVTIRFILAVKGRVFIERTFVEALADITPHDVQALELCQAQSLLGLADMPIDLHPA